MFAVHSGTTVHGVRSTQWRYRTLCSQYRVGLHVPCTVFAVHSGTTVHCVRSTEWTSSHACMLCFSRTAADSKSHAALHNNTQHAAQHSSQQSISNTQQHNKTRPQNRNKRILPVKNGAPPINQFLTVTRGS